MPIDDETIAAWIHGALDGDEAARVAALIDRDPALARRAEKLKRLDEMVRRAVPVEDALPADLLARLGLPAPETAGKVVSLAEARAAKASAAVERSAPARFAAFAGGGWRIAAQVLIVAAIGLTATQWWASPANQSDPAEYRALGDAADPAAGANALVVFADDVDPAAARAIAGRFGASIADRPNAAGAWRLTIAPARRDAVLEHLRAMPEVRMAEPLGSATP